MDIVSRHHPNAWQEQQSKLLEEDIEVLLAPLSSTVGFYELVKDPLTKARRGLADNSKNDQPWHLIPLMVCEAICGHCEHAIPAAAALQLLMTAGDVFDDIEDADSTESLSFKYGSALATNAATTLLTLAEKAISRLKERGVANSLVVRLMNVVNTYYATACAGQHLDLSLAPEIVVSEDIYLKITGMKSASQVECACHIGALLANANQELVEIFASFGNDLGMAAQITNDIHGITRGNDIVKRKVTLPIIYALTQTDGEVHDQLSLIFEKQSKLEPDPAQIRALLYRVGAIHYATVILELYKQRALDMLSKAETAGANVKRLKLLLD